MTRQDVILKYLGRKHNLIGQGASEQALVDQLMAETLDLHKEFRSHVYKPDFQVWTLKQIGFLLFLFDYLGILNEQLQNNETLELI